MMFGKKPKMSMKPEKVKVYPEQPELKPAQAPTAWYRRQIVIPCADDEQMLRISEKLSSICGHSLETTVGMVDSDTNQILGEVVFARTLVPNVAQVAVDEPLK